jgi:hypothetical protein
MTDLTFDDVNRLILDAAGVPQGGRPGHFHRGYIAAGHASDSPANRRLAVPVPPEGGGRSSGLCATPDPGDDGPGEARGVEKVAPGNSRVVEPEHIHRSYLRAGHAAPSPADAGDNNPVLPVTGSGAETYRHAVGEYNANVAQARAEHVMPSQACPSRPAPAQYSPPADLGARNVPQPRAADATRKAPGE